MLFITRKQAVAIASWLEIMQEDDDHSTALVMVAEDTPFIATKGAEVSITIEGYAATCTTDGTLAEVTNPKAAA